MGTMSETESTWVGRVDRATRRLWHTSQHSKGPIWLAGRIQEDVNELRTALDLPEFGWDDSIPDEAVGRCSVHPEHCAGQHTHNPPGRYGSPSPRLDPMSLVTADEVIRALIRAGVVAPTANRVVIDLQPDSQPVVYVEQVGTDAMIEVLTTLQGVEISTVLGQESGSTLSPG